MCWREGTGHLGALSWMHELGDRLVVQDGGTQTRGLALAVPQAARQLGGVSGCRCARSRFLLVISSRPCQPRNCFPAPCPMQRRLVPGGGGQQ